MARRPQLTAEQRSALFDPPRLPRELVRHYTLSGGDLDLVLRCRGDHNRLGYAWPTCGARDGCCGRKSVLRPNWWRPSPTNSAFTPVCWTPIWPRTSPGAGMPATFRIG